jgi:hypothetical protein
MSTVPSSRKRKRELGLSDAKQPDSLSIELSSLSDTQIGPVLGVCVVGLEKCSDLCSFDLIFYDTASFPYIAPPKNTAFNISVKEEEEGKEFVNCSSTIAGETNAVEFSGSANDGNDGAGSRCDSVLVPSHAGDILNFP